MYNVNVGGWRDMQKYRHAGESVARGESARDHILMNVQLLTALTMRGVRKIIKYYFYDMFKWIFKYETRFISNRCFCK